MRDEARHDGHARARAEPAELAAAREARRERRVRRRRVDLGVAELGARHEPERPRIARGGAHADRAQVRRDDAHRDALAERDDAVAQRGRELLDEPDAAHEARELGDELVDRREHVGREVERGARLARERRDRRDRLLGGAALERGVGGREEQVRRLAHRAEHNDRVGALLLDLRADQLRDVVDARVVRERRAAEFHDDALLR